MRHRLADEAGQARVLGLRAWLRQLHASVLAQRLGLEIRHAPMVDGRVVQRPLHVWPQWGYVWSIKELIQT